MNVDVRVTYTQNIHTHLLVHMHQKKKMANNICASCMQTQMQMWPYRYRVTSAACLLLPRISNVFATKPGDYKLQSVSCISAVFEFCLIHTDFERNHRPTRLSGFKDKFQIKSLIKLLNY